MEKHRKWRHCLYALMAPVLLAGDLVWAQAQLEEIVVTARKREEKLQDLPLSVTAIDAAQIERQGIRNLGDIAQFTPGVNLDNAFGLNDQRLVIRGLSPSRGRPNSAILVDGIDLTTESVSTAGGSMLFNQRLLDIQQVEVVKGPQSALYGRAAFSGAIQYVTRDPGDTTEGEVGIDIGEDGRRYIRGGIGGPVTDTLGLRFTALSWNEDGYYDESFTGSSLGGGDGYGLSLVGLWDITDNFSARARVAYSDDEYDQQATIYDPVNTLIRPPSSSFALDSIDENTVVGLFGGSAGDLDGRDPILTPDPATGKAYDGGEQDVLNTSLKLDWDIGSGTLSSYTGYAKADNGQEFDGDFDTRPDAAFATDIARGGTFIDFDTDTRLFSQELRYASNFDGPVQITLGALYWDEDVDQTETGVTVLAFPFGPAGAPEGFYNTVAPNTRIIPNNISRDTNSRSVYGMLEWDLAEQWKLTLEARYAREEMDVTGTGCDPAQPGATFRCGFSTPDLATEFPPGSGMFTQLERVHTSDSTTSYYTTPRAIIEWTPLDELLTYFSLSQGIKPGGIATVASGTWMDQEPDGDLDELKFDDEKLTAYELGAKSTLADGRLILNGALFFQDYDDKQIPVQTISGGFPFTRIANAGEAEVWGVELESTWLVTDNVRLQLGYAWLDAEYTDLVYVTSSANSIARAGNCTPNATSELCSVDLGGNTLEDVPEHSIVALAGYYPALDALATGLSGILEADLEWQDSRYIDEFNDREVDAYTVVNLRGGVQTDRWDALVYVNNVFDDDTIKSWSAGTGIVATAERTNPNLTAFPGEGFAIAPPPRQWGVRANLRF